MSTLTAAIDLSDGLAHVGLQQYTELFRQHEIGRPLMELCEETREIWDELFASDLAAVAPCVRCYSPCLPHAGQTHRQLGFAPQGRSAADGDRDADSAAALRGAGCHRG